MTPPEDDLDEARALLRHLVAVGKLELCGSTEPLLPDVAQTLHDVTLTSMAALESLLLECDAVEEIYADAAELYQLVYRGDHLGT